MFKFLLGCEPEPENPEELLNQRRRWTCLQIRDFGEVHLVLAYMILSCDLTKHRDVIGKEVFHMFHFQLENIVVIMLMYMFQTTRCLPREIAALM